jgi:hypothetical protein
MSEQRDGDGEDGFEDREDQVESDERQDDEGGGADDDEDGPKKPPEDWEKRAHNHAGQAAKEKSRRRAAERRNQELEQRIARLEGSGAGGRLTDDDLTAAIDALRDDDDDPITDIQAMKRALRAERDRRVAEHQQTQEQQRVERIVEGLRASMIESEEDFALDHPDYHDAARYFRQSYTEDLEEAGYSGAALQRKLSDDLFGIVHVATQNGLDPAERVYNLARKRGFKPGMKAADRKLDTIQRASESGAAPRGKAPGGALSWGDVAKLDGAARDKAFAKLRERERGRRAG